MNLSLSNTGLPFSKDNCEWYILVERASYHKKRSAHWLYHYHEGETTTKTHIPFQCMLILPIYYLRCIRCTPNRCRIQQTRTFTSLKLFNKLHCIVTNSIISYRKTYPWPQVRDNNNCNMFLHPCGSFPPHFSSASVGMETAKQRIPPFDGWHWHGMTSQSIREERCFVQFFSFRTTEQEEREREKTKWNRRELRGRRTTKRSEIWLTLKYVTRWCHLLTNMATDETYNLNLDLYAIWLIEFCDIFDKSLRIYVTNG